MFWHSIGGSQNQIIVIMSLLFRFCEPGIDILSHLVFLKPPGDVTFVPIYHEDAEAQRAQGYLT